MAELCVANSDTRPPTPRTLQRARCRRGSGVWGFEPSRCPQPIDIVRVESTRTIRSAGWVLGTISATGCSLPHDCSARPLWQNGTVFGTLRCSRGEWVRPACPKTVYIFRTTHPRRGCPKNVYKYRTEFPAGSRERHDDAVRPVVAGIRCVEPSSGRDLAHDCSGASRGYGGTRVRVWQAFDRLPESCARYSDLDEGSSEYRAMPSIA
jgi:hypothetical protein